MGPIDAIGSEAAILPFMLAAYFIVPALLARYLVRASWLQVACSFPGWWLALWLILGGPSISLDEGLGWTMVMSMFFSWLGVPLVAFVCKKVNVPNRWL